MLFVSPTPSFPSLVAQGRSCFPTRGLNHRLRSRLSLSRSVAFLSHIWHDFFDVVSFGLSWRDNCRRFDSRSNWGLLSGNLNLCLRHSDICVCISNWAVSDDRGWLSDRRLCLLNDWSGGGRLGRGGRCNDGSFSYRFLSRGLLCGRCGFGRCSDLLGRGLFAFSRGSRCFRSRLSDGL